MFPRLQIFFLIATTAATVSQAFTTIPSTTSTFRLQTTVPLFDTTPTTSAVEVGDTYVRCGKCEAAFPVSEESLGRGRGRRLECSVCSHSWFQSKDRLLSLREGFEMVALPEADLERIQTNIQEGKSPKYMGDCKLYVGNIAFSCHEDDLHQLFSQMGSVGDVSLVRDEEGRNRGFGFITMRSNEDGQKAIDQLDGTPVRGRNIAVRESNN